MMVTKFNPIRHDLCAKSYKKNADFKSVENVANNHVKKFMKEKVKE
jgi:hypothetical protein